MIKIKPIETLRNHRNENGKLPIIAKIMVDTQDELPLISTAIGNGYTLHMGSSLFVIQSDETYVLGSDGEWYEKRAVIGSADVDSIVSEQSENPVKSSGIYEFVNSSVATNTAHFKGTKYSRDELQNISDATNNDYAFLVETDDAGNTVYNRYKYNGTSWVFEYSLNNSSFTANQWKAINSGITADKVSMISTLATQIAALKNYDDTAVRELVASETSSRQEEDSRLSEEIALNRSTLGYQRKNLLKNTAVSKTVNGVTFTVNDDGSVTANGTATDAVTFVLKTFSKSDFSAGRYIYSGCNSGSADTYFLRYYNNDTKKSHDIYDGSITIQHKESEGNFAILVKANTTIDTVFCPMFRYAEITDDTYEPYKPSVEERLAALESGT